MDLDNLSEGQRGDYLQPVSIPDHKLVRCIGRGSYGEVWLAQNVMGAYRAVKVVHRKSFHDHRPFERELAGIRKFEPVSRSHEGFIDVLHVGMNEQDEYFYYLMELGDDQNSGKTVHPENYLPKTLARELSLRGKLPFEECLHLGLALSQALAELHKQGLVHRDVKPSNIIFANGIPKLADIGLVAGIGEAHSYVGTEGFIPPEGPGTPQADIYGLGKVLYEASTGKDRHEFPELPTKLDEFPNRDGFLELNEVILAACKKDARKRYQSALDMCADLQVIANGKSVKRLKLLEHRLSQFKRAGSFLALALLISTLIAYPSYREWRNRIELRQRQIGENVAYGNRAVESGDLLGALPYFAEALRLDEGNLNRKTSHRLQFASTLAQCPKLTRMWFLGGEIRDGEFSPDGQKILIPEFLGKTHIYDVQNGARYAHPFAQGIGIWSAVFSPDGKFVLTTSEAQNNVCVWNAVSLGLIHVLPHPAKVYNARFSSDGFRIVSACKDGIARVWNAKTARLELMLKGHSSAIRFAAFSPDNRLIVTTSDDDTARIWNAKTGRPVGVPLRHGSWVNYAAFSPDNRLVVTACSDHKARIWEVATGRKVLIDLIHNDGVESAEFSPDGQMIVTASLDGTARIWRLNDLPSPNASVVLPHSAGVTHACFNRDGHRILTTCTDGSVRLWDLAGVTVPPVSQRRLYSQNESRFLTITNNTLRVWDAISDTPVSPPINAHSSLKKAELTPNGLFVVAISLTDGGNHLIQVWNSSNSVAVAPALQFNEDIDGFSLSDDGKKLVIYGGEHAQIWSVTARTNLFLPLPHSERIDFALFSPSGKYVAAVSGKYLYLWHAGNGQALFAPLNCPRPISYAAFSLDSSRLVTCCSDDQLHKCSAQVWDVVTGHPVGSPLNHDDGVLFASFSPNGREIATASEDYTAKIWNAETGTQLVPPLQHSDKVQTATFSADGQWVVTASADKTARVWSAETGDPLTPPFRQLTPLASANFLPDESRVVTCDNAGNSWTWSLPAPEMSTEDIEKLSYLLSDTSVSSKPLPSLQTIWRQLRNRHPSNFIVSPQAVAAWYEYQAEKSETNQQWFAVTFYLKQLLLLQPNNDSLAQRLARATKNLQDEQ